jgi:hypothetical protein
MNEEENITNVNTERGTAARRITRETREFEIAYDSEEIVFMSTSEDLSDNEKTYEDNEEEDMSETDEANDEEHLREEDNCSEDKMTSDDDSVTSAQGSSSPVPKFKKDSEWDMFEHKFLAYAEDKNFVDVMERRHPLLPNQFDGDMTDNR